VVRRLLSSWPWSLLLLVRGLLRLSPATTAACCPDWLERAAEAEEEIAAVHTGWSRREAMTPAFPCVLLFLLGISTRSRPAWAWRCRPETALLDDADESHLGDSPGRPPAPSS